MFKARSKHFESQFRRRVLLPGILILVATGVLCGVGLIAAGRGTDDLSLVAQQAEVWRMTSTGLDDLAVAQESIGLCESCVARAADAASNRPWIERNIARRLYDLHKVGQTFILDGNDRPVFAAVGRKQAPLAAYDSVLPSVEKLVNLARGRMTRPNGLSNLNERLPGVPSQPFEVPPIPGFTDAPTTVYPSVRTTPDVTHATDIITIGDRIAFASVMVLDKPIQRRTRAGAAKAPLLVSLRLLDGDFLAKLAQQNYLSDARIDTSPTSVDGETSAFLMNSEGRKLATLHWKPVHVGGLVVMQLLGPAALAFGVIALLLLFMALRMRSLMKRDDENIQELQNAHLELKAKEAQAHHLAYHDVLTGLPNRALFNDGIDTALTFARHGERMAIVLLDLDRFKNVNDRFGHLAGDELIRQVGNRLVDVLGCQDSVARLGGDEFALLLRNEHLEQGIEAILGRILGALHQPFDIHGNRAHIGASIGIALAPEFGTERTDLMRKADIALYRAKDEGRDCYRFFTDSMDETVQFRAQLEEDLRQCLAAGEGLGVHYQPLVDCNDGEIVGLEALLRWKHPEQGWISPQVFVTVAEETGLIGILGEWVVSEACKVARAWPQLTISINLSPMQFCQENFAERLCELVRISGAKPSQIEFEVTEGVVLDQNDSVRGALRHLRKEGFRIALDDFGTGYSSLNYLREFEVDRIKIDKSFVQSLGKTVDANAIITAVVTLGHAMGLQVTAEGVETSDQENFLRAAGCNVLQGYLFSKAVPAQDLRQSVEQSREQKVA